MTAWLGAIKDFAHEQGVMALIAIMVLLFSGKVIWAMSNQLALHAIHDGENNRLLRVICLEGAKDDNWRQACLDTKYDENRLAIRTPSYQAAIR